MTEVSLDELGPVDYVVVEFPAGASNFTGEMVSELLALVDAGTIRVIDTLILTKDADGAVEATELSDVESSATCRRSRPSLPNFWQQTMSSTWQPPWTREARPASSFRRTCGLRRSRQRLGVLAAN